jgi:hypothetical protein
MELLGDVGHVKSCFGPFGDILVSMQGRSTVCTKRTIASETVLDATMELLGDMGHAESCFDPFRDSVSFGAW